MPSGQVIGRRGVARDVTKQVLAEKRVRELSRKLISTQEEERKRIALDLHDEMGQMLSALKIGLQALAKREESRDSEELARLIRLTQVVMDQIRALAHRLRPSILDNFGLKAALEDLCETLAESELLEVVYNLEDLPKERISPEMEISLFRVAQEALTNVLKHSQSERVEVRLEKDTDRVRLIVEDQGVGFDLDQALEDGKRLGLLGMEERIGLLGGHLSINTGEKGTTILAEVSVG
jgi:signal transduction histidine kinase